MSQTHPFKPIFDKNSKILIIELLLIIILLAALIVLSIEKAPSIASKSDKVLAKKIKRQNRIDGAFGWIYNIFAI